MVDIDITEDSEVIRLKIKPEKAPIFEREIEKDDLRIGIGLTPDADIKVTEIIYPSTIYRKESVEQTARIIREKADKLGGCPSCMVMKEASETSKTFIIPTIKELLDAQETKSS